MEQRHNNIYAGLLTGAIGCTLAFSFALYLQDNDVSYIPDAAAASQGPNNASTFDSEQNGVSVDDWNIPGNAEESENQYAIAQTGAGNITHYIKATDFGFSLPSAVSPDGIEVTIERSTVDTFGLGVGRGKDTNVHLIISGVIRTTGDNKAKPDNWPDSTDAVETYGGSSDGWGLTILDTDVNSIDFGVAISVEGTIGNIDARIDHIQMKIYYTVQCSETAGVSETCGAGTEANEDPGGGEWEWTNIPNTIAADDDAAEAAHTAIITPTQYLKLTNYGFSIPTNADVTQVQAVIRRKATVADSVKINSINLLSDLGESDDYSGNAPMTSFWGTSYGEATCCEGSGNEKWNQALKPAHINDADFGVKISSVASVVPVTSSIDRVQLIVYYSYWCGNGAIDLQDSETCDDGNTTAGDGCSATCTVESGYFCGYPDFPAAVNGDSWSQYELQTGDQQTGYKGFVGAGDYLYTVPFQKQGSLHGEVARLNLNTSDEFTDDASWEVYDPSTALSGNEVGFQDAIYDGSRYIYYMMGTGSLSMRYDTQDTFNDAGSWLTHNPSASDGSFGGSAFDGRYIYLSPYKTVAHVPSGEVMRFDTQGTFNVDGSWTVYDPSANGVGTNAKGYHGAVYDGARYVYFVPFENSSGFHGEFMRYDTQGTFSDSASWTTYDPGANGVGTDPDGFKGAVFDTRYIYFVPNSSQVLGDSGEVLRFDTQGDFQATSSWSTFDMKAEDIGNTLLEAGFAFGGYDGKYVYFVPERNTVAYHQMQVRYDTSGDFTSTSSWEISEQGGKGYYGPIFIDAAKQIYYAPYGANNDVNAGNNTVFLKFGGMSQCVAVSGGATCGNGTVESGETCDDGNTTSLDGCSSTCQTETATCGNGIVESGEDCEPPGAGRCSDWCVWRGGGGGGGGTKEKNPLELPPPPPIESLCGNGKMDVDEECDEGEFNGVQSCSEDCKRLVCGDGIITPFLGETCEPEEILLDNGSKGFVEIPECSDTTGVTVCASPGHRKECTQVTLPPCGGAKAAAYCGDGKLDEGEQCDFGGVCDGGRHDQTVWSNRQSALLCLAGGGTPKPRSGDGCNDVCAYEFCGDGVLQSTEQCDSGSVCQGNPQKQCVLDEDCGEGGECVYAENRNSACLASCKLCGGLYAVSLPLESLPAGKHTIKVEFQNQCGLKALSETEFTYHFTIPSIAEKLPTFTLNTLDFVETNASGSGLQKPQLSVRTDKAGYVKLLDEHIVVSLVAVDAFGQYIRNLDSSAFTLALDGKTLEDLRFTEVRSAQCPDRLPADSFSSEICTPDS